MLRTDINASTAVSAICISSFALLVTTYLWKKKSEINQAYGSNTVALIPRKWVKVGTLKKLIIYPIKSCGGVIVDNAMVTTIGLKFLNGVVRDRDFMVVDENGKILTMTIQPRLALIHMESDGITVTLHAPDMPDLTFTYPQANGENERFYQIRNDSRVKGLDCGDETSQWFQKYLGNGSRLIYHHLNHTQRTLEKYMYDCPQFENSDMGAFHNESAYLLCSEESIDELNKRLTKASSWKNFRPNILIDQVSEPFAEVNWSFVKIGNENGIFKAAVPCRRCPLTTVDQNLGVLPGDGEPLKTLRQMKIGDNKVADKRLEKVLENRGIMGIRLGHYLPAGEGAVISTGDPVYAALL